jgi:hypothetical protein
MHCMANDHHQTSHTLFCTGTLHKVVFVELAKQPLNIFSNDQNEFAAIWLRKSAIIPSFPNDYSGSIRRRWYIDIRLSSQKTRKSQFDSPSARWISKIACMCHSAPSSSITSRSFVRRHQERQKNGLFLLMIRMPSQIFGKEFQL